MKDQVIIEHLGNNKVSVSAYDEYENVIISQIGVLNVFAVQDKYDIVGEIIKGELTMFTSDNDEEFDYKQYSGIDMDEDE